MHHNLFKHLKTINTHKKYVRKMCFKMGIPWQGLTHDLSKYSLKELSISKYYIGTKSPHQVARDQIGYSPAWINHYHKNKHHYEYWWDDNDAGQIIPIKIPYKYVIEMFCDMVGANRAYSGEKWSHKDPLTYWNTKCQEKIIHQETKALLTYLFCCLNYYGEKEFIKLFKSEKSWIKEQYNKGKKTRLEDWVTIF